MMTQSEGALLAVVFLMALLLFGTLGVEVHRLLSDITRDLQLTGAGS